ncbi:hypothetical protein EL84_10945 [Paenibacillus sp. VT-400]|nr:hypothetical protein EL84_10945 [Paenibacillus sp. VT-400]
MSLPIEKHPGNLLPEMGRLPGCFVFSLPIRHGRRTGPEGGFFCQRLMCLFIQKRFVHRIIHKAHQQHTTYQITERHRNQVMDPPPSNEMVPKWFSTLDKSMYQVAEDLQQTKIILAEGMFYSGDMMRTGQRQT